MGGASDMTIELSFSSHFSQMQALHPQKYILFLVFKVGSIFPNILF